MILIIIYKIDIIIVIIPVIVIVITDYFITPKPNFNLLDVQIRNPLFIHLKNRICNLSDK